ncbi:hypothetical protein [Streptomyces smyrnaeus]|uniref:hypothetical protein n=1 Tax=Streptomyces smyrnaeus TaxID=1387713 RepID=UPI0036BBC9C5
MVLFKEKTRCTVQDAFTPKVQKDPDTGETIKDEKGRPVKSMELDPLHLVTMVWLLQKKKDPNFSFEDAMNVPAVELDVQSPESDPKDVTN